MAKFHIGKNGPAKCAATKRACPVGGDHFDSMTDAVKTFEKSMAMEPLWMQPLNKKQKFTIDYTGLWEKNMAPSQELKNFAQNFRTTLGREEWIRLDAENLALTPNHGFVFDARVAEDNGKGKKLNRLVNARVELRPAQDGTFGLKVFNRKNIHMEEVSSERKLSWDELVARVKAL